MKNLLLTLVLFSSLNTFSANNLHVFKTTSEAYVELSGDQNITNMVFDDGWHHIDALTGQTWKLFNRTWTMDTSKNYLGVYRCGRIAIMGDTVFSLLDGMYTDSVELIDAASKISYKIEGNPGKQVLKLQWKNIKVGSGPAGNYFNLQIWVYQEDGLIEFRYGDRSASNASGYTTPATGLYIGIWHSQDPNFYAVYEKINLKGTPPAIIVDSIRNTSVPNIQGIPASGTVYRFIPKTSKLSIANKIQPLINIYPNPAGDFLQIDLPEEYEIAHLELYDLQGKQLLSENIRAGDHPVLDLRNLKDGNYFLRISGKEINYSRSIRIMH